LFSYTTKVVWLGNIAASLEVGDLPIAPADMRATINYSNMKRAIHEIKLRIGRWSPRPGSGWGLAYRILKLNGFVIAVMLSLAAISACLFYTPALFLNLFVLYLENDEARQDTRWGWVYVAGLFFSNVVTVLGKSLGLLKTGSDIHYDSMLVTGQLWSISTTTIQVRFRMQLNSILFAKTLVRKDIASSTAAKGNADEGKADESKGDKDEDDFSSKAQIMTLMTTDVDRVSEIAWHMFALVGVSNSLRGFITVASSALSLQTHPLRS